MSSFTIGQLARRAGVGVETVRFYERRGLIAQPPRRASGYREYPPEAISRITFIRRAKELGYTLKEIAELLELRVRPRRSCDAVKRNAEAKISDIEAKIESLRRMRKALRGLVNSCEKREATSECPILSALGGDPRVV
jgi:MerR family mercuric resistance operon transcriptional regulator